MGHTKDVLSVAFLLIIVRLCLLLVITPSSSGTPWESASTLYR